MPCRALRAMTQRVTDAYRWLAEMATATASDWALSRLARRATRPTQDQPSEPRGGAYQPRDSPSP
jgi:hypothetical protein